MAEQNILDTIPPVEMRIFLRDLARLTEAYFQNEEVNARFQKWLKEKRKVEEGENRVPDARM